MAKDCVTKDHLTMFHDSSYQDMLATKKAKYEQAHPAEKVAEISEWTKSAEYKEKNFERKSLVVNPLKSCQPLGALLAALGFANSMPYVHGSQGCAAYFRSHFSRHFKEPIPAVSDSMTEDAAVFGGHNNMYAGLETAYAMYKPEMFAIFTTCMAEVIGDDLNNFVKNAKAAGHIPEELPVVFAHTPSFIGSHITGYDAMMQSALSQLGEKTGEKNDSINIIVGYDTYVGNYREIKRICSLFGVEANLLSDPTDMLDSPAAGEFKMYNGGTPSSVIKNAPQAKATVLLQKYALKKTAEFIENNWEQQVYFVSPYGVAGTDELMVALSEITGKPVPAELEAERGRLVDAISDSYYWVHGKTFSINADPDQAIGVTQFIMELGGEPRHVLLSNGNKPWKRDIEKRLKESILGQNCDVYFDKDMWHWRSLLFTEPVDYIIGNSHAKFLWRDTKTPLIRFGFPVFDRHHLHRYATIGYAGGINLLNWVVNTILDEIDRTTMDSTSFDLVR